MDDDDVADDSAGDGGSSQARFEGISHTHSSRKIPVRALKMAMTHRGQNRKCTDDQVEVVQCDVVGEVNE